MSIIPKDYHKTLDRPDWTVGTARDGRLLWLDKNENLDPEYNELINDAIKGIANEVINTYPDCSCVYQKLAQQLDVNAENLVLAAGSDGVIRSVFDTFVSVGDKVLITAPTFAMYAVYAQMYGANTLSLSYRATSTGLELDIASLEKLIHDECPRLICLPNPDSPTGTLLKGDSINSLISAAHAVDAVILIDEAYYPYSDYTALPLIHEYQNLIVARTFSKAWGIAGARVGFAIANNELAIMLHRVRPMYEIGNLSLAVVDRVLALEDEMLKSVARLNAGKLFFETKMQQLGLQTLSTAGNFQHVAFAEYASDVHSQLASIALYRQDFPNTVLAGYSRFSATTQENFQRVVDGVNVAMKVSDSGQQNRKQICQKA